MSDNAPADLVPALFPVPFCDHTVSPELAAVLHQYAARIRRLGEEQTEKSVQIGSNLLAAKELLSPEQFGPWFRTKFGMTDQTAAAYLAAATRKNAADAATRRKPLKPKLVAWAPGHEGQSGLWGHAHIELPTGLILEDCPVYTSWCGLPGPHVMISAAHGFYLPDSFWRDEFNDDIVAQIREVELCAFEEEGSVPSEPPRSASAGSEEIGTEDSSDSDSS
jgi:hypothetical protein